MTFDTTDADDVRPSDLVGAAVQRREDPHLITGDAEYTDDIAYPNESYLALLGSRYGHAYLTSVDMSGTEAVETLDTPFSSERGWRAVSGGD